MHIVPITGSTLTRLAAMAAVPGLALVPVLHVPFADEPITTAVVAQRENGYVAPVEGQVARRFDPPAVRWEAGHRGVDFWSSPGAVIRSPGAGVVTFAGSVAGKPVIVVAHPDGLRTSLEPVLASVSRGDIVKPGDPIGSLAAWGGGRNNPDHCAGLEGPGVGEVACVHWGVRRGEVYIDPLSLLGLEPIVLLP
jgi:murein DD-endopeptidase MepM/ murein hydrolase activator NlpD